MRKDVSDDPDPAHRSTPDNVPSDATARRPEIFESEIAELQLQVSTLSRSLQRETAARIDAEIALQSSEIHHRQLFNSIDEGFCVIDLQLNHAGVVVDGRFVETNAAFERQTRILSAAGRTLCEGLAPDIATSWLNSFRQVVETGESVRFETNIPGTSRWSGVIASRIGLSGARIAVVFSDITDRKLREANLSFLTDLGEELSRLTDATAIVEAAAGKTAQILTAARCVFMKVNAPANEAVCLLGQGKDARHLDLSVFVTPEMQRAAEDRQTIVVRDTAADPCAGPGWRTETGTRSFIAVPLDRGGVWRYLFAACDAKIRDWRSDEIDLVCDVAHRVVPRFERANAEAEVRASEERLRTLADAVPQIMWTNDGMGRATYFNLRWYEYSGLTFEQSFGLGWETIAHPDDLPASTEKWRKALAAGVAFDCEYRLRRADGEYRWFIGRNVPLREAGKVTSWFGTATDINDLKEAQAVAREREEQFRRAIEDAPIPVIMHAEDGQVLQISHSWTKLTGYAPNEVLTLDAWLSHAYGSGAEAVREHMKRVFAGQVATDETEIEIRTRTGERRHWVFSSSAPGTLRDGRRFAVGMALDVTDRKRADEALAASQERLRLIVESAVEHAIFAADLRRRIVSWNAGAERLLGYTRDEMIGEDADRIFTPEDRAAGIPEKEAHGALVEGRAADERWHVRKDGSRFWGSGAMLPMRGRPDGEPIGFVKIFRDETEKRQAREALEISRRKLEAALETTERARAEAEAATHAKDRFIAVLSHELRTPLTPVLLAAHTLALRRDLPEPVREGLAMIRNNVRIEARLIDDLLDITRIVHGRMELTRAPMDMHLAIHQALDICRADIDGKNQRLTIHLDAKNHQLLGDATRLQQVVWNLLKNASKFTPEGGSITIATRNEADRLIIVVSDNGIGIEEEALTRIFDAFAQAHAGISREFGGLGLGLSISKAAVEAHGGTLYAESAGRGFGAAFFVKLPLN